MRGEENGEGGDRDDERAGRSVPAWKWLVGAALLIGLLILARTLPLDRWIAAFNGWIAERGSAGMVIYAAIYVVWALLLLPGSVLTAGAGFAFGIAWGTVIVSSGSTTAAALAFLIARYLARSRIADWAKRNRQFGAIDAAVGREGWKIVGLLRLSPAIPFSLSNYLYGLTAVRFWPYVAASWLGMLPGTLLYVYLGAAGKRGLQTAAGAEIQRSPLETALFVIGLVATLLVTILVTRMAQRALREPAEKELPTIT